jgi:hypothetical protein
MNCCVQGSLEWKELFQYRSIPYILMVMKCTTVSCGQCRQHELQIICYSLFYPVLFMMDFMLRI